MTSTKLLRNPIVRIKDPPLPPHQHPIKVFVLGCLGPPQPNPWVPRSNTCFRKGMAERRSVLYLFLQPSLLHWVGVVVGSTVQARRRPKRKGLEGYGRVWKGMKGCGRVQPVNPCKPFHTLPNPSKPFQNPFTSKPPNTSLLPRNGIWWLMIDANQPCVSHIAYICVGPKNTYKSLH